MCGFSSGSVVKSLPANAGDTGLIPRWGRFPGGGNGNPLQHSCLGKPLDREAYWATVHGVAKELDMDYWLNNEAPCSNTTANREVLALTGVAT